MKKTLLFLLALLLALASWGSAANAQSSVFVCVQTSGISNCAPVSATNPLPVLGTGGTGGSVTIADGADVTQGALADAACATDNGTCSEQALLKRANQRLTTAITALGSPLQAGGVVSVTAWGYKL